MSETIRGLFKDVTGENLFAVERPLKRHEAGLCMVA
jgi:hypothetical protein